MNLNVLYDAAALAAPQSFRDGIATAVGILDSDIHDNITVNIAIDYGEFGGQALPNQNTSEGDIGFTGSGTEGQGVVESYSNLRNLLASHATTGVDYASVAALPTTTSLQGHSSFTIGTAQAKALGVISANATAIDGQIGMEANFTGSVLVAGALHELTHAMGRIAGDSLDLFRYSSPGNHVFGFGIPAPSAYFSVNGGSTDLADFGINSDPGDFLNSPGSELTPNDPFNEIVTGGITTLTSTDLTEMDVLGFNVGGAPYVPFDSNWSIVGVGDFNGDHLADLAWERASDNLVEIQLFNGSTPSGGGAITNSPFDSGWFVAGRGDFNGDSKSDLVFRRVSDDLTEIQFLNGNQGIGGGAIINNPFDATWNIVATGDFNGDGKTDLAWRRSSDGLLEVQFLNGIAPAGGGVIANNPFDSSWNVVARGDFNGDGKTDLVWRRSGDGLLEIQFLNGTTGVGGGVIPNNPFDSSWNVVAAGDFLGNGRSDLVWQRASDGLVEIQYLNGTVGVGGGAIQNNPFGAGWQVVGAADFSGDGKADLVYRRASDELTEVQFLNGTTIIGGGVPPASANAASASQMDSQAVNTPLLASDATLPGAQNASVNSQEPQNDLSQIYWQVLGRDADSGGLAAYQDVLGTGATLDGVRSTIAHSPEAQADLARLFDGTLNRDPTAAELAGAENQLGRGASLQSLQDDLAGGGSAGGLTAIPGTSGDATFSAATGPTAFLLSDVTLGNDSVTGFDPTQDTIVLSHAQLPDFSAVIADASATASGTLIALDPMQSILLNGVAPSSLHANNFQFV